MRRHSGLTGMSRRQLLQVGAAGAGVLGLPFVAPEQSYAQSGTPQRLLLVFTANGTIPRAFWPTVGATETEFTLNTITEPLEPFKDRLLFLKGLDLGVAKVGPGGPHQKGVGGLFTNSELQTGDFTDGDGSRAGWANGPSVDQEVARFIGGDSYLPSVELGVRAIESEVRGRISYAGPGRPMPPMNSPLVTYQRLFSGFISGDAASDTRRQSVLDVVKGQYDLLTPQLSLRDKLKLEQHMELVRGIERRMDIAVQGLCERPPEPPELAENDEQTMAEVAALQVQLLGAAFSCDLTRVASLQFSTAVNAIRYPWLDSLGSGHTLSHASDADSQAELITRRRWMAEQLADLMTLLDALPEGDGTALDHTLIVWGNELSEGNTHSHANLPFMLAGGAKNLRMGRVLDLGGTPHGGLLVSILNAMGIEADSFGHPDFAAGPLMGLG